ncbi:MAG: hypothetical protein R2733_17075 [Acidimicrobiales bacterium]
MTQRSAPAGLADGEPFAGELVAFIDETSPQMGAGIYYVLTSAVTLDVAAVTLELELLFADTPNRTRGFHWHREGPAARQRMIDIVTRSGVIARSRHRSVARNKQIPARLDLLCALADDLVAEGIDHLVIESGDTVTNNKDKTALLTHFEPHGGVPFAYDWRSKNEKVLWIPDAINGALHAYYTAGDPSWFKQLCDAGVLDGEPVYTA